MGMEIRSKVKEYVRLRIRAIREESERKEASATARAPPPSRSPPCSRWSGA